MIEHEVMAGVRRTSKPTMTTRRGGRRDVEGAPATEQKRKWRVNFDGVSMDFDWDQLRCVCRWRCGGGVCVYVVLDQVGGGGCIY